MRVLSGELDYRIRYDVEHDLFHAQNIFNDEYIKPTFIEYVQNLEKENAILKKALKLYVNWADECGIGWDNFPDMTEKWYKTIEEKGLGWIDGLIFMVTEEAKELLNKE